MECGQLLVAGRTCWLDHEDEVASKQQMKGIIKSVKVWMVNTAANEDGMGNYMPGGYKYISISGIDFNSDKTNMVLGAPPQDQCCQGMDS